MLDLLEFRLEDVRYALPTSRIVEVAGRVLVTPLAGTQSPVLGVVCFRGTFIPVIDLRARLGHPVRAAALEDHFVVAQSARRTVALVVDRVTGLCRLPLADVRPPPASTPHIAGIAAQPDGLLLIEDLDAVLTLEEEAAIDSEIEATGRSP